MNTRKQALLPSRKERSSQLRLLMDIPLCLRLLVPVQRFPGRPSRYLTDPTSSSRPLARFVTLDIQHQPGEYFQQFLRNAEAARVSCVHIKLANPCQSKAGPQPLLTG